MTCEDMNAGGVAVEAVRLSRRATSCRSGAAASARSSRPPTWRARRTDPAAVGQEHLEHVVEVVHGCAGERPARRDLDHLAARCEPGRQRGRGQLRIDAENEEVLGCGKRRRPCRCRHPNRGELTRRLERRHRRRGRRLLDRRAVRHRRALDRDGDAERRAGAARVLELAGEHVQAVGEGAGREGELVAGDDRSGRCGAVEQRARRDDRLARGQDDLVGGRGDGSVGRGRRRRGVGAVLSNRTFARTEAADGLPTES